MQADFTSYWICVGIEYVLMTASYVSSWSIVVLTLGREPGQNNIYPYIRPYSERYLAIVHPLKHVQVNDKLSA